MEISLETIKAEPSDLGLSADPAELELRLDLAEITSPVTFKGRVWRIEDEIFLDGVINYAVKYTCARCLTEFINECELPLNLVLQLVADDQLGEPDDDDDQFVMISAAKTTYALDQHVRDLIALEAPLKPVCREDCAGLCPQCGTNRNETQCECQTKPADSRWEALRKLSENENNR